MNEEIIKAIRIKAINELIDKQNNQEIITILNEIRDNIEVEFLLNSNVEAEKFKVEKVKLEVEKAKLEVKKAENILNEKKLIAKEAKNKTIILAEKLGGKIEELTRR